MQIALTWRINFREKFRSLVLLHFQCKYSCGRGYSDNGSLPTKNKFHSRCYNGANIIKISEYHAHEGQRTRPNMGQRTGRLCQIPPYIPARYFADLVGIQGTGRADNAASTLVRLPIRGRIRRTRGTRATFPDIIVD